LKTTLGYLQGCSTLRTHEFSQCIEAFESGSVAILTECAGWPDLEEIESETAQAGEDTGIASYA
jgi:hypothetical protein